jgi:hypothetical protein
LDYQEIHTALSASGFNIGIQATQLFFRRVAKGAQQINFTGFLQMGADIALVSICTNNTTLWNQY